MSLFDTSRTGGGPQCMSNTETCIIDMFQALKLLIQRLVSNSNSLTRQTAVLIFWKDDGKSNIHDFYVRIIHQNLRTYMHF